jgi:hypothetical protein
VLSEKAKDIYILLCKYYTGGESDLFSKRFHRFNTERSYRQGLAALVSLYKY